MSYYIFQSIFSVYSVYIQCEGFAKLTFVPHGDTHDGAQEGKLRSAFDMFDSSGSGLVSARMLPDLLAALGYDLGGGRAIVNILEALQVPGGLDGNINFDHVVEIMSSRLADEVQTGRNSVLLSLVEAEAIRAIMHAKISAEGDSETPLIALSNTALSLRHGSGNELNCLLRCVNLCYLVWAL